MKKLFVLTSIIIMGILPVLSSHADSKTEASPVKIASVWKNVSDGEVVTVQGKLVNLLDGADVLIQDRTGLLIIDANKNQIPANKIHLTSFSPIKIKPHPHPPTNHKIKKAGNIFASLS